jgi:hypothetical protein
MKKAIAIVLSLMFIFALTSVTFAAEKKAAHKQITGEVTAVDAKANTVTVKSKKAEVTVSIDDKTKFTPKGKTIADVKDGEKVMVKYTEADGKNTAKIVKIKESKKAEKMEKKEAAPAMEEKKAAPKKSAGGY